MKQLVFAAILAFIANLSVAQSNPYLTVKKFTLDNGLTVWLNEDNSSPEIFGAVVVRAGGKNDPADATGIAHYFEHMMFKGTDRIGTIDWEAEKVYLDSISMLYDQLAITKDENERKAIQRHINRLSIQAANYAIPNETDFILQNIGSTGLNAYTSEEETVYFNLFPSNQVEKWLDIYAERFRNPVFRLFQSELETVYEEKNMYADDPFSTLFEKFMAQFFKKHPYGQQTILGTTEHLKNPRLSKMMEFFETYYVANNMALILSGNFNSEQVLPMIQEKFGKWPNKPIPSYPVYEETPFKGREEVNAKLTPIALGVMGFRAVPNTHPDNLSLQIGVQLLSNSGGTGFLDQLTNDNKMLMAQAQLLPYQDHGALIVFFAPKIIGQKLKSAEKLVLAEIERLKKGEFSEELLEGIKLGYRKSIEKQMETNRGRSMLMIQAFSQGKTWEDIMGLSARIDLISKDDVIKVANQYLTSNYLMFNSKMGFPKKDKIQKPDWEPVVPQNTEKKSEYAQKINAMPEVELKPRFVDFKRDLNISAMQNGVEFYYTVNPINTIFTLTINFKAGTAKNKKYEYASSYMNYVGTDKKSLAQLKAAMQSLGATVTFYSSENSTSIRMEGFDSKMEEALQLLAELLLNPQLSDKPIKKFIEENKANYKAIVRDPEAIGDALAEYAKYKDKSDNLDKLSEKEIKQLKAAELVALFKEIMGHEAEVHYVGTMPEKDVKQVISKYIPWSASPVKRYFEEKSLEPRSAPAVYIYNNPKAIQSKIYLFCDGETANNRDRAMLRGFNEYFGAGMSSIVFQEIREFRSLGYAAYAYYQTATMSDQKGHLYSYLGTQNDKVTEGTAALYQLIVDMPQKPERMDVIRRGLVQGIHTQNPSFRNLSSTVSRWKLFGYKEDPRIEQMQIFETMSFEDILSTYQKFVKNKPVIITIAGDFKVIDKGALSKYGPITELKLKDFVKK
jgi:zinc protease